MMSLPKIFTTTDNNTAVDTVVAVDEFLVNGNMIPQATLVLIAGPSTTTKGCNAEGRELYYHVGR